MCGHCGITFYRPPSHQARFCSRKHYHASRNHTVVGIVRDGRAVDTYDIEVEDDHNFALEAGVFVHNSQIELRILAHYSRDSDLIQAFHEGKDVHAFCAALMFGVNYDAVMRAKKWKVERDGPMTPEIEHLRWLRHAIKTVSFALVYGASEYRIAQELSSMGQETKPEAARELMDLYFNQFQGVPKFMDESIEFARTHGYVTTLLGHIRRIPEIRSKDFRSRNHAERCAVNTPIQGTACDVMKLSMGHLDASQDLHGLRVRSILQVHDEILFEIPEEHADAAVQIILSIMGNPGISLRVPMVAEAGVGHSWYDAKNA